MRARTVAPGASRSAISSTSFDQVCAALEIVEADVELRRRRGGDDVAGVGRGRNAGEFEVRRREGVGAVVEMKRIERRDDPRQLGDRIVGAVGVGDMALRARHVDPHVDRAAPADLDRVAQPVDRGRLADQDHVGADAALVQPIDDPRRAVGGIAFLVAGDQQARACPCPAATEAAAATKAAIALFMSLAPRPVSTPSSMTGSNGSLAQPSPGGTTSRWPAKPKCGAAFAPDRDHILGRPVGRFAHHPAMDLEASWPRARPQARRTPRRWQA